MISSGHRRQLAGLGNAPTEGPSTSKLFLFPSDIAAAVRQTDTEITSLAADYDRAAANGAIDDASLAAYNEFYNEWRDFADNLSWWAKMAGSTVAQCQVFRQRANSWRKTLIASGGRPSTPELLNLPPPPGSSLPWLGTVKWVAGAAVTVAAIYGLSQVLGFAKSIRAAPRPVLANPRRRRRRSGVYRRRRRRR